MDIEELQFIIIGQNNFMRDIYMRRDLKERIIEILFEEVGKIKVHIIDSNSSILEIEYEEIADKILQEMQDWLGPF
jgi:hypothetical protein